MPVNQQGLIGDAGQPAWSCWWCWSTSKISLMMLVYQHSLAGDAGQTARSH